MAHMMNASGMHSGHGAHHAGMDHSNMHGSMDHSGMSHGNMNHGSMDHGSMDHIVHAVNSQSEACPDMGMHGMSVRIIRIFVSLTGCDMLAL